MRNYYSIGVDFGTDSGRVVLVDTNTGETVSSDVTSYRHGVITDTLPNNTRPLPPDFALQHPHDYLEVLETSIPNAIQKAGINKEQVIGIGVDFTSSTMIPTDENFIPLCFYEEWKAEAHAYAKLWKHHGANREADILNALAVGTQQNFLSHYGGTISCEWMIPKCVGLSEHAPACYDATEYFIEAGDWIVAMLTGQLVRNNCAAGFKSFWDKHTGYPQDFFEKISPVIGALEKTKLRGEISMVGSKAGNLLSTYAEKLGLSVDLPVSTAIIDAHSAVLGMGASEANTMAMVMGTSTCHITLSEQKRQINGISGVVEDGIVPGLYAYEAGQSAVGDIFAWFRKEHVPAYIEQEASKEGMSVFDYLEEASSSIRPGQTGLLALDWHNGNRSVLNNPELSGMIIGQTLQTKPEEVFLALMEATAFGAKAIMEAYKEGGILTETIYACGGLPANNKRFVQIYADVTNCPIRIASSPHVSAVGAAILGSVAAGSGHHGHDTLKEAMFQMSHLDDHVYFPIPENVRTYEKLYQEYQTLSDYFGKGANLVMERLREQKHMNKKKTPQTL